MHCNNILYVIDSSKFLLFLQDWSFLKKTRPLKEVKLNQSLFMHFPRYDYAHIQTRLSIATEGIFIFNFGQEKEEFVTSSETPIWNTAISQVQCKYR